MKDKLEVYTKARNIAINNNQTVDVENEKIGEQGDYFITLAQLEAILMEK